MENYKKDAGEMLKKATLSESWKNQKNQKVYALMIGEEIIGYIREKVDINRITLGEIHETWRGKKIDLLYNNKHIGFLWA